MEENEDKKGIASTLMNKGAKAAWDKLPTALKIKIIAGAGIFLVALIIFMAIIASFSTNALAYSDDAMTAKDNDELKEDFKEYWYDLCEYGDCNDELIASQKKFYEQVDKMVRKYNLNAEQKYTLLATIFYDYEIEEIRYGDAFVVDDTNNEENIYDEEKDTIKNLAKRFKSGESDNKSYYDYLKTTDYFDKKDNLKSYFQDYADSEGKNLNRLSEAEKVQVRSQICENIKDIVEEYMNKETETYSTYEPGSTGYWWPIGSKETSTTDGKLFANGTPETVGISSYFGPRVIDGVQKNHSGIDIPANANSANVIASMDGEVVAINNSCNSISSSDDDKRCGDSYGNYIKIEDIKGNTEIYAHLYRDTITVAVGDVVRQGQVIAKVGSSGNSQGPHLHFEMRVNGERVDPLEYIAPEKPRGVPSSGEIDFFTTVYSLEEFVSIVNNYYSQDNVCNSNARCNLLRDDILNGDGARIIYEVATERNRNPELIFPRMILEGYASGNGHNYFSYGCGNTQTLPICTHGWATFREAAEAFFDNAAQYSSLLNMMRRYAYIGAYWYNIEAVNKACCDENGKNCKCGAAGVGGCIIAPLIYGSNIPARVASACSHTSCSHVDTSDCVATTAEDQEAYAAYQVTVMDSVRKRIFK